MLLKALIKITSAWLRARQKCCLYQRMANRYTKTILLKAVLYCETRYLLRWKYTDGSLHIQTDGVFVIASPSYGDNAGQLKPSDYLSLR